MFTAKLIIFLPLSFFTSYFGMNVTDIVRMAHTSKYFSLIAGPVSGIMVIAISTITRLLDVVKDPVLDEDKATSSKAAKDKTVLWSRLRLGKGKMKSN